MKQSEMLAELLNGPASGISPDAKLECSSRPDHWKVVITDGGVAVTYHHTDKDGWTKVKEKEHRKAKSMGEAKAAAAKTGGKKAAPKRTKQ